ncbi:MAG: hypothetical protein AB8C84_04815 [Oligoflexales bacterium]
MRPISCHVRHGSISLEMIELCVVDGKEHYDLKEDADVPCCKGQGFLNLAEGMWRCSLKSRLARLTELRKSYLEMWESDFSLEVSDQSRQFVDQSLRDGKGYRIAGVTGKPTRLLWESACVLVWYYGIPAYVGRIGDGLIRPTSENAVVFVDGFSGQKVGTLEVMVGWCYGACLPLWVAEGGKSVLQAEVKSGRYAKMIGRKTQGYRDKPWFEKSSDMSLKRKFLSICHEKIVTEVKEKK